MLLFMLELYMPFLPLPVLRHIEICDLSGKKTHKRRTPQLVGNFEALRFIEAEEKGKIRQKKAKEEKN